MVQDVTAEQYCLCLDNYKFRTWEKSIKTTRKCTSKRLTPGVLDWDKNYASEVLHTVLNHTQVRPGSHECDFRCDWTRTELHSNGSGIILHEASSHQRSTTRQILGKAQCCFGVIAAWFWFIDFNGNTPKMYVHAFVHTIWGERKTNRLEEEESWVHRYILCTATLQSGQQS